MSQVRLHQNEMDTFRYYRFVFMVATSMPTLVAAEALPEEMMVEASPNGRDAASSTGLLVCPDSDLADAGSSETAHGSGYAEIRFTKPATKAVWQ